jgi:hypothetical protein
LSKGPKEIFTEQRFEIVQKLKMRRDRIIRFAERYYTELAKTVDVRGTNQRNAIDITFEEGGNVQVEIFDLDKDDKRKERFYNRSFIQGETKYISIYALGGKDRILIKGKGRSGIGVNILGGDGKDVYINERKSSAGISIIDDQKAEKVGINAGSYKQTDEEYLLEYDREAFKYDYGIPLFAFGANPDDGLILGGGIQWVKHGFKKDPYASKHSLQATYAFNSESFSAYYEGEWTEAIGKLDFRLGGVFQGKSYVQNFFGLGNDTPLEEQSDEDKNYNRVNKRNYALYPAIVKRSGGHSLILEGSLENQKVAYDSDRFIGQTFDENSNVFDEKLFGGVGVEYRYRLVDNPVLPRRGIDFSMKGGLQRNFDEGNWHQSFESSLAMYFQMKRLGKPVIALRAGTEIHGGDYEFYQGAILGSKSNFRGVRKERFAGDKMLYFNGDIRYALVKWRSYYLPAAMGIVIGGDYGRVWYENEDSDTWHYAYGGGLWVTPFQTLLLSLNYHISDYDKQFSLGMGFFF